MFRCDRFWYVKLELAGVRPGELTITASEDTLSISGYRKDTLLESNPFYHSLEIAYSEFNRRVRLPFPIDTGSIQFDYQDGMLLIRLECITGTRSR